jgi:uncharacterized membrane protein YhiD involved in acid resistance
MHAVDILAGLPALAGGDSVLRLAAALVIGFALGFEPLRRDALAPPLRGATLAGLAALLAWSGEMLVLRAGPGGLQELAPLALAAAGGLAWLALGTLILGWRNPEVLAGAAGLWTATTAGLAAGAGLHIVAVTVMLLSLLFVNILRWMVAALPKTIVLEAAPEESRAPVGRTGLIPTLRPIIAEAAQRRRTWRNR